MVFRYLSQMLWKVMDGFNRYLISDEGQVKNVKDNKIIKGTIKGGYLTMGLYSDEKKKSSRIHILVAKLFCENPNNYRIVNHINGNKLDNRSINLEWTTIQLNTIHAVNNGLLKPSNYRPVIRTCVKTGNIKRYDSIQRATDDPSSNIKYPEYIISVCTGIQKTSAGFLWKYETDETIYEEPEGKCMPGYENYIITSCGKVYSKHRKRYLSPSVNYEGYFYIDLRTENYDNNKNTDLYVRKRNAKRKKFKLHFLIATCYIQNPNPDLLTEVNHKDKNRQNNNISNLEWISQKGNLQHAHNKPVLQLSSDRYFISIYDSLLTASNITSIPVKNISSALRKNMKASGFIWEYAAKDEYMEVIDSDKNAIFVHYKLACLRFIE